MFCKYLSKQFWLFLMKNQNLVNVANSNFISDNRVHVFIFR